MPCLKRKVVFDKFSPDPKNLEKDEMIFYIPFTKEKFRDYESYYERIETYISKQWQCAITGKTGLTYLEALESEKLAGKKAHNFSEVHIKPFLEEVHYNDSNSDYIVDWLWYKFNKQYVVGEKVTHVDSVGNSFLCEILHVTEIPLEKKPKKEEIIKGKKKGNAEANEEDSKQNEQKENKVKTGEEEEEKEEEEEEEDDDDDFRYEYTIKYIPKAKSNKEGKIIDNVKHDNLRRKKIPMTKVSIRQFLKASAHKERYIGAPWIVNSDYVEKYGLSTVVPKEFRDAINRNNEKENMKRQKLEMELEKESEEKGAIPAKKAKVEKIRKPREAKIVYPIEDTELPEDPNLQPLPILSNDSQFSAGLIGSLLSCWHFLRYFSRPLKLYPFNLEDFEGCLAHFKTGAVGDVYDYSTVTSLLSSIYCQILNVVLPEKFDYHEYSDEENWHLNMQVYIDFRSKELFFENDLPEELRKVKDFTTINKSQRLLLIQFLIDDCAQSELIREFIEESTETCFEATKVRRAEKAEFRRQKSAKEKERRAIWAESGEQQEEGEEEKDEEEEEEEEEEEGDSNTNDNVNDEESKEYRLVDKSSRRAMMAYQKMKRETEEQRIREEYEAKRKENALKRAEQAAETAKIKKVEDELNELEKEESKLENKYTTLMYKTGAYRRKPLGMDRNRSVYHWLDAKIYVKNEESNTWGYYSHPAELEQLRGHLNIKGVRELKLYQSLSENSSKISATFKKRQEETRLGDDGRRSSRNKGKGRGGYFNYENTYA